ncbi:hypothetical protein ACOMHN_063239 [Nucella lapillus]
MELSVAESSEVMSSIVEESSIDARSLRHTLPPLPPPPLQPPPPPEQHLAPSPPPPQNPRLNRRLQHPRLQPRQQQQQHQHQQHLTPNPNRGGPLGRDSRPRILDTGCNVNSLVWCSLI